MPPRPFVLALLLLAATTAVSAAERRVQVVSDTTVATFAANPLDIRWSADNQLALALGKGGVVRVAAAPPFAAPQSITPPADRGGFFLSSRMAISPRYVLVASPFGGLTWQGLAKGSAAGEQFAHDLIMDADLRDDRIAILGARTGNNDDWSPDGALVWTGSLSKSLKDFKPLMYSRKGKGSKDVPRCHALETGAVRFLHDGSLVVMPGVEPDVYRYSAAGKLLQTWQTDPLGVEDDCRLDDDQMAEVASDPARRAEYLAARVTLDDILPLPEGPALVLRFVQKNTTAWRLAILHLDGRVERIPLPVTSPSSRAHIRGDVRGNRMALLVTDYTLPGTQPAKPRIVLAKVPR